MGNRSSSHYPPPPPWMHHPAGPRGSYSTSASPYPDMKRPIAPGAYAEPYLLQPQPLKKSSTNSQVRRSMMSLNGGDSGYVASPENSARLASRQHLRSSRLSLNQLDFDTHPHQHHLVSHLPQPAPPRLIMPPDAKTLKKLEKMEKKHQKLLKKLGARGIQFPMPPPPLPPLHHPMYSRAMSFDDLHRLHEAEISAVPMRNGRREWRSNGVEENVSKRNRREAQSQYIKQNYSSNTTRRAEMSGSLASSSPMTSSEEGGHSSDPWNNSSISSGRNNINQRNDAISPPMYSSTPQHLISSPPSQPVSKNIEVKVERNEKTEQQTTMGKPKMNTISTNQNNGQNAPLYAQPIIRNQQSYDSRASSIATSQIRCDQSEIDFSWVNEEEDKLKRETGRKSSSTSSSRLPEYYFGMDPPRVNNNNTDEKENHHNHHRHDDDDDVVGNDTRRRRSAVQEKTQQFELEARRLDRKELPFLSRSTHHLSTTDDIPHPDYSPLQIHTKETGPAERRIYRIQRQSENPVNRNDDRRYRSSIAF